MNSNIALAGNANWRPINPVDLVGSLRYVSGEPEGERLRLKYYEDESNCLVAKIWFGPGAAGPPGHAHGGSISAVFDEVLGLAGWHAKHSIVVANLNINFRAPLPLNTTTTLTTSIQSILGKKVTVTGTLIDQDGTIFAEGSALLIIINPSSFGDKNTIKGCV